MRLTKLIQLIMALFLIFFLASSVYHYVTNQWLIKTAIVREEVLQLGHQTFGFTHRREAVITAPFNGSFQVQAKEGQRIGRNVTLVTGQGTRIASPISGVVSYRIDGFETPGDLFARTDLDLEALREAYAINNQEGKDSFESGEPILKITDNLDRLRLYLEVPLSVFSEPLQTGGIINVVFPEDSRIYRLRITRLKGIGQDAIMDLQFVNEPDLYERFQPLTIIAEEKKGVLIPKKAVQQQEEAMGVFTVEKGFIRFRTFEIIGETEEAYLTNTLPPLTEIILTPGFAREGRYIR